MKVVDERGRLFGKLNLIDLVVIIFILAAIVVVGIKVFGGGGDEGAAATKLTYTVRVTGLDPVFEQRVAEYVDKTTGRKDQLMANGAVVDAYIVDFWTEPTEYMHSTDLIKVPYEQPEEGGLIDICFVIEANVANATTNEVGTQEVRIGKTHTVKTIHFEFVNGVIMSCSWDSAAG